MMTMYDDNFGFWDDADDPAMREFYGQVQSRSVVKSCEGCGREVRLLPEYAYCNGCADAMERGGEL
jgi:hypothetical protein